MKKRNKIIIVIILLVFLLGSGVVLFKFTQKQQKSLISSPTKSEGRNSKDQPVDNPDSDNSKKVLAQQIKADLQKDLAEAKKEEKSKNNGFKRCSWSKSLGENCTDCRGNEWRLTYFGSDKDKYKERKTAGRGWIEVFSEELESNDWKEIEGLIQQVKELENEKKKRDQEEQAKIDQKLNSNPKLFLYGDVWEWWENDPRDYDRRHVFRGIENGQEFLLVFPENHPAIASLNQKQKEALVLIEGVENISLQSNGKVDRWKKVNLSDKINITPANS